MGASLEAVTGGRGDIGMYFSIMKEGGAAPAAPTTQLPSG